MHISQFVKSYGIFKLTGLNRHLFLTQIINCCKNNSPKRTSRQRVQIKGIVCSKTNSNTYKTTITASLIDKHLQCTNK